MLKDQDLEKLLALKLGEHIRKQRQQLTISQGEAGFRSDIDEKNFSKHEQGTRTPKLKGLYKMRRELNISIEYVIDEIISIREPAHDEEEE